ncbi:phospholipid scramblase 1 [Entomortierella chlamydospora]|uniref:Phospholipid scramblase 1 n=1 Tax=Entomortierella chlamydospora TaxID=101097 RepID=A0A9P6MQS8_9FUNG|nr:phospholipid scramblase 1 [Entomortierella chlamydospora]KAG0010457.1 phospholipid scramblase 1 [Entomortierella chlamydospora]
MDKKNLPFYLGTSVDREKKKNVVKIAEGYQSSNFSEEQIASFKESFDAFDRNGDGSISASELRLLLRIVGAKFRGSAVGDTMAEFDTNHDQHIDFNEFLMLVDKLTKNKTP